MNILPIKIYVHMSCEKPIITTKLLAIMEEFGERNGGIYVNKQEDVLEKAIVFPR